MAIKAQSDVDALIKQMKSHIGTQEPGMSLEIEDKFFDATQRYEIIVRPAPENMSQTIFNIEELVSFARGNFLNIYVSAREVGIDSIPEVHIF